MSASHQFAISLADEPNWFKILNEFDNISSITHLKINNCNLTALGAASLCIVIRKMTALFYLDLGGNEIGPVGGASLIEVLPQMTKTLRHLDLSYNYIRSAGAVYLSTVLHHLTALQYLYLAHNNIGSIGAASLISELYHLNTLQHLNLGSGPTCHSHFP